MRQKSYVIAKGLPGQAILKQRAMAGETVYNWCFMSPAQLASELRQSYGICLDQPVLSNAEAAFFMYELMKDGDQQGAGRYFHARSIADAEVSLRAINRLRLQLTTEEEELDGLKQLLAEDDHASVIPQKNRAIVDELAGPYLAALKAQELEDSITLLRKTIIEGKDYDLPLMAGLGYFVEERPLAPLERELAQVAFGMVAVEKETWFLGDGACTADEHTDGAEIRRFDAYGASNEVRRILEEIQADGKPLDNYLIACADPNTYGALLREYSDLPLTVETGERVTRSKVAVIADRILNWHRNAYTKESFQALADHLSGRWLRERMMEDGIEEKEARALWKTVLNVAKNLYFSLDTGENLRRLYAYEQIIKDSSEKGADKERRAMPYCEIFAEQLTAEGIVTHMVSQRNGFEAQCCGSFLSLLKAAKSRQTGSEIELLPSVVQLFEQQRAGGGNPEAGKLYVCSWNKAHLYRRPVVYLCGLQKLTGSLSEDAVLLDGDVELVRSRVGGSDLKTTTEQIKRRSEDFLRIVDYLKKTGAKVTLSWSNYSLSELKGLSVPAVLADVEAVAADRAGFVLEKAADAGDPGAADDDDGRDDAAIDGAARNTADRGLGPLPLLTVTPSAGERMLNCPYSFVLTKILGIREPEDEESQTVWLSAAEKGTLCHSVFEEYVRWERSEEVQNELAGVSAEEAKARKQQKMSEIGGEFVVQWRTRKPYRGNEQRTLRELSKIFDGFLELWETIPAGTVAMTEQEIEDRPIVDGKLQCHGIPDLVMNFGYKDVAVLDYKTGRTVKHEENDVVSCVQTLLYCMMLNQNEYPDTDLSTKYLYPLAGTAVGCRFDDTVADTIRTLFALAINKMETGQGWLASEEADAEVCRWCKLKEFCMRPADVEARLFENEQEDDGEEDDSDDDR